METKSARQTQKVAKDFLSKIPKKRRSAFIVALTGDLGSGKTTFTQGLAKALGIKQKITSPTFVIYKRYENFYHFDCYRIEDPKEVLDLGFKKIIQEPKNIVAIEWAEKIKTILPQNTQWINFKFINQATREIKILG